MKDRLAQDLKTAMLARDHFLVDVIKGLKATILNQEIAQNKRDQGLGDQDIEALLAKEAKKRLEAAELYAQGGNQAMADKEQAEYKVIMQYLPEQLSKAEITELVEAAITATSARTMADMGKVVGAAKAKAGSAADGALIATIVKNKLQ